MDLVSTGKTIAKLRKSAGLTQASLAEKLGISDKAISKWERGMAFPDTSILNELCILLDTDIESILYGCKQSDDWLGILILDKAIPAETLVFNKPLIHYLLSQFLLVGIREIVVVGKCEPIQFDGINISCVPELNQQFTKKLFIIYGNQFLYGPNLTKHFMRAMSRDAITVIAAMKAKGNYGLYVDSNRKGILSDEPNANKYYALPSMILSLVMGVCVLLIGMHQMNLILVLLLQVVLGAVIYIALSKIFRLEAFDYIWTTVKQNSGKHKKH